jgi:hypothetical protein
VRRSLLIGVSLAGLVLLGIVVTYAITHINTKVISPGPQASITSSGVKLEVTAVTFHEGFRAAGKKAVDVVLTLIGSDEPHIGNEGKIISITGTSGQTYNTDGGPLNTDGHKITCFRDVADTETNIVSIVFQDRTGKNIEIPIRGITPQVTHK